MPSVSTRSILSERSESKEVKMKKIIILFIILAIIAATIFLYKSGYIEIPQAFLQRLQGAKDNFKQHSGHSYRKPTTDNRILYYTCGMHPSVRVTPQDYEKGNRNCPICQMA